eukprot:scaffold873_cov252-Pinguiococcus_pyrenoidosus.AAC.15
MPPPFCPPKGRTRSGLGLASLSLVLSPALNPSSPDSTRAVASCSAPADGVSAVLPTLAACLLDQAEDKPPDAAADAAAAAAAAAFPTPSTDLGQHFVQIAVAVGFLHQQWTALRDGWNTRHRNAVAAYHRAAHHRAAYHRTACPQSLAGPTVEPDPGWGADQEEVREEVLGEAAAGKPRRSPDRRPDHFGLPLQDSAPRQGLQ